MKATRLTLIAGLFASAAQATPTYTVVMQEQLMMSEPPRGVCAVCHTSGLTAAGTVNTPFGRAMRSNGLVSNDEDSLRAALAAVEAAALDSDRDGCTDIAELKAMPRPTNPNRGGDCGGTTTEEPEDFGPLRYGCGAQVAPGLLLAALALWFRRR